jgi:methylation protein EvaC
MSGKCLVCSEPIAPFIDFGRMPIANGFLRPDQYGDEFFFNLRVGFCPSCTMVQLTELVDETKLFHDEYAFFSSTSRRMAVHFQKFATWVKDTYLKSADPFVAELGCNDGIMLSNFAGWGMRHVGIEPSANVADVARGKGINVISEFFDENVAKRIITEQGQADAVMSANVMCHIPYLHSVAKGIAALLKPTGILAFEDPYLGDIVTKTSYDQIYDEHVFYFSVSSVSRLFGEHGLEVIDVLPQTVHGGSMRYVLAHKGAYPVSEAVQRQRAFEAQIGLHLPQTYEKFRANVEASRDGLLALLKKVRDEGKRVVGYAATSKSTTVTNYCGIGPELVEFISDTTPIKHGKFSPGTHIPVKLHEDFVASYPDYALLFGWNHGEEIKANEKAFTNAGGRWIEYVPDVRVTE